MLSVAQYALTIFVSAYLLFQVQPIIARYILPWFGGGSAVWTTCMLFFQVFLFFGYFYAHVLSKYLPIRKQALIHIGLLLLTLLFLPITPSEVWKPENSQYPALKIILLLLSTIGGPYLLVSSTGPLLQRWFSLTHPGKSPYRFFSLSNFASLLGLLTYPFIIEPLLGLKIQTAFWSIGYACFVLFCGGCAVYIYLKGEVLDSSAESAPSPETVRSGQGQFFWLMLSTLGVVLLLAVTNQMTQNITPIPFLWVLPLSLYLITFIMCFNSERWYPRRFWIGMFCMGLVAALFLLFLESYIGFVYQIILYSFILFSSCMVCHGELYRLKPQPEDLTFYYLNIALGGALGGGLVTFAAPLVFNRFWEFQLGLFAVYLLMGICIFREASLSSLNAAKKKKKRSKQKRTGSPKIKWMPKILWGAGAMLLLLFAGYHKYVTEKQFVHATRNFYGRLTIQEREIAVVEGRDRNIFTMRSLIDGQIEHGSQIIDPRLRLEPTIYFSVQSGIGIAVRYYERPKGLHMGIIGLGAGTIAAYGEKEDVFRFYDINPDVKRIADDYFYYLGDSKADLKIVLGDGRISLERELKETGGHDFDILVLDAFTSDAIPMHLVTKEAFELYLKHLKPDGLLALHVSNNFLDLSPVVRNLARQFQKEALFMVSRRTGLNVGTSLWILVTNNEKFLRNENVKKAVTPWPDENPVHVVWTDDYCNLYSLLRKSTLKFFRNPLRAIASERKTR